MLLPDKRLRILVDAMEGNYGEGESIMDIKIDCLYTPGVCGWQHSKALRLMPSDPM